MTDDDLKPEKEDVLRSAKGYAAFLSGKGNVKRVGLFGSVARGVDDPGDIDIVLFLDNAKAQEFLEVMQIGPECEQYQAWVKEQKRKATAGPPALLPDFREFIQSYIVGLSDPEIIALYRHGFERHEAGGKRVNFLNLSNDPTEEYLGANIKAQRDPTFFDDRLMNDMMIYDPESGEFAKESPWSDEVNAMIKEAAFERLKELSAGKDESHLDWLEQNPRREG